VEGLSEEAHEKVILQSYSALVAELAKMLPDKSPPILLVKVKARQVLERRLRNDGFTLLTNSQSAARCGPGACVSDAAMKTTARKPKP
jgi:hypothetical protein